MAPNNLPDNVHDSTNRSNHRDRRDRQTRGKGPCHNRGQYDGGPHAADVPHQGDGQGDGQGDEKPGQESVVIDRTEEYTKPKKPALYKVVLVNDDYTPMEFVIHILQKIFAKTMEEATRIMLHIHRRGSGVCGIYPYQIAETKACQVIESARGQEHPLQCLIEKE